ncbi:MAG TPA: L-aspartate oxidase [Salinivirga sp.]|uniref:L-aspartate oxidase n=1 Tax=Salinivirga sp. TaxID=1970192 RepID=UPI002B487BBD|nr:L-aspartate oxidase [Salinivirga sp.]HKK60006.1 L-aspartate oxidase [Salinivirga sp.]
MRKKTDFLIIGSGLAGLTMALKASKFGKVILLSKGVLDDNNTVYAQGGIAAVTSPDDSFDQHVQDTMIAGAEMSDEDVVKKVVAAAPPYINELVELGTNFDKLNTGGFELAKEGGHSKNRILHHKDNTGYEIHRALLEEVKSNEAITIYEEYFAIDLITQHHLGQLVKRHHTDTECYGAYVLDIKQGNVKTILAKTTMLASGGAGNLYMNTTNPLSATGDGIAMTYRAKGIVDNMEFVQFHPTSLYNPGERPAFLISEAVRGFGGILRTLDGKEFMHKYDERGCLAPRDIVARAIDNEIKTSGDDHVWLDCSHLDSKSLVEHFPNIHKKCLSLNIDITKDPIPVTPAAHYICGGVKVDLNGRTSIKNLYAAGETSNTGLHGANRLASNSLLEGLVYAHWAVDHAAKNIGNIEFKEGIPDWNDEGTSHPEEMVLITQSLKEVQQIMSVYVGIVRSEVRLQRAYDRLWTIYNETESLYKQTTISKPLCELRNIINVAYLVIKHAYSRKKSVGLHYIN